MSSIKIPKGEKPKFALGKIIATPGSYALKEQGVDLGHNLGRHWCGDWGDVDGESKAENDHSIASGLRLVSLYNVPEVDCQIYIVTEADRSVTTVMLPEEI